MNAKSICIARIALYKTVLYLYIYNIYSTIYSLQLILHYIYLYICIFAQFVDFFSHTETHNYILTKLSGVSYQCCREKGVLNLQFTWGST